MQVIPVINCSNFECIKKRFGQIREIGSDWAHIDVADGKFAPVTTWNKPEEILHLISHFLHLNIEVHLMVENPEAILANWLAAGVDPVRNHARARAPEGSFGRAVFNGVKRIIVHFESIHDREEKLSSIFEKCSERGVEVMLAINPETPADELTPFLDELFFVQILAVPPGPSGQKFDESVIEKIRFLRERAPEITIEIDGGMNPETAKLAVEAGAGIIASGAYIFRDKNPRKAYQELQMAVDSIL